MERIGEFQRPEVVLSQDRGSRLTKARRPFSHSWSWSGRQSGTSTECAGDDWTRESTKGSRCHPKDGPGRKNRGKGYFDGWATEYGKDGHRHGYVPR